MEDIRIINARKKWLNKKFENNSNDVVTLIKYNSGLDCSIQFTDGTIINNLQLSNIRRGQFLNPNKKTFQGIGYIGIGQYNTKHKYAIIWKNIIERLTNHSNYSDCKLHDDWCNMQTFCEWFENNHIDNFEIDKDILVKNNKVYGPDTCCFVPQEINKLFYRTENKSNLPIGVSMKSSGNFSSSIRKNGIRINLGTFDNIEDAFNKYKEEKEKYIIDVANKWKHLLKDNVYHALINYKITK